MTVGFGRLAIFHLAALALLAACRQSPTPPPAPGAEGVCWRAAPAPPKFIVVSTDSDDLESCAMDLEMAYLGEGRSLIGAYQGSYIFIGPKAIQSAAGLDLFRYPIFNRAQRAALDIRLRELAAEHGRAPLRQLAPQGGHP
jgi:hypothetical protein